MTDDAISLARSPDKIRVKSNRVHFSVHCSADVFSPGTSRYNKLLYFTLSYVSLYFYPYAVETQPLFNEGAIAYVAIK